MESAPNNPAVSRGEIQKFFPVLAPHIRRTPVISVDGAEFGLEPARLTLKLELLQHTGSFKARGAMANLLTKTVPQAGVVAASGGNHGVAIAFAAQRFNVPA
ncbi:MAG TPA: pyridoxal-phosphate dependent enzyme, partial [Candidatus Acidoferrum sp.]|nr:pyridoxal-phosphate dependent enzyme [Candidatus Acidoferrum sp.]